MDGKDARLLARIEAGERIESVEEMTDDYRANLIHLMTMQADSELAGAFGPRASPDCPPYVKRRTRSVVTLVRSRPTTGHGDLR